MIEPPYGKRGSSSGHQGRLSNLPYYIITFDSEVKYFKYTSCNIRARASGTCDKYLLPTVIWKDITDSFGFGEGYLQIPWFVDHCDLLVLNATVNTKVKKVVATYCWYLLLIPWVRSPLLLKSYLFHLWLVSCSQPYIYFVSTSWIYFLCGSRGKSSSNA